MQRSSIGFMVDVIDASILAVITGRDGGLFLITLQHFLLCISHSRDEATKIGNKGGGAGIQRIYSGRSTEMNHFHGSSKAYTLIDSVAGRLC